MLWVYIVVEVFRIEQKGTIQLYEIVPQGRSAFDRSNSSIIRWHRVNVRTRRGRRVEKQKKKKSIFAWSGRAAVLVIENFNIFCCKTSGNNNPPPRNNFSSLTPLFIFHSSMLLPVSLRSFTFFVYAEFRYETLCVFFSSSISVYFVVCLCICVSTPSAVCCCCLWGGKCEMSLLLITRHYSVVDSAMHNEWRIPTATFPPLAWNNNNLCADCFVALPQ